MLLGQSSDQACHIHNHLFCLSSTLWPPVAGDQCSGGSNIFAEIPENSPYGTLVSYVTMFGEPVSNFIQLSLSGIDAKWFYLDEKAVRLNVSEDQVLDREVSSSLLPEMMGILAGLAFQRVLSC